MSRSAGWVMTFTVGAVVGAAAAFGLLQSRTGQGVAAPVAAAERISSTRRNAIVVAAERVSPAVVSVSVVTTRVVRSDPFGGLFRDEFFERFYPPTEYRERVPGMGSGFIMDRTGLILTNSHVVRNAEQISVTLLDGRQLPAKLLGATETYDVAVLKVDAANLPVATLGNSDDLVVGEWAIAIGNPFGYLLADTQPSVTAGVISATGRDIKSEATDTGVYKNMIQTDAAINPGNSGGPLVNSEGEVIGVNTFIFTQGGGSLGMGFALPINLAKRVVSEIQKYGRVRSAWPGMQLQVVTPYLASRLGLKDLGGLIVSRVDANGPAAKAGIRPGDRIRVVNGREIRGFDDAQRGIYGAGVGDRIEMVVERDGRRLTLALTLAEAPRTP
jgi:serine protease Do